MKSLIQKPLACSVIGPVHQNQNTAKSKFDVFGLLLQDKNPFIYTGWNFLEPSKDERSFEHSKLVNCTRLVEDEQVELKLVRNLCNILHVEFKLMGSGMKHEWNVLSGH
ncbi:uncharacterized protein G2W53_031012 [Senna tora]|uniref:Uncharacterized protein n=1 Tax=Senna tora TaxID=362788 RepID=A0A834T733_9FABA|nr:uncharacterized protein G2W53_031012 [Senna tora]